MDTTLLLIICITVIISAGITILIVKNMAAAKAAILLERANQLEQRLQTLLQQQDELQQQKQQLTVQYAAAANTVQMQEQQLQQLPKLQMDNQLLKDQLAMFKAKFQSADEKLATQKAELEQIGERFRFEFKHLAQSILEEKTARFTQVNEEKLKAILDPLKLQLGDFKQKVEETYDKESKERFSLGKEIEKLILMSQQVSQEANNLTTALKGNTKMQGNWGEMILESILEYSGLTKGREYLLQEFIRDNAGNIIKDENGKGLQPDVTIYYPDLRKVIIDSKVSLVAWEQYIAATDAVAQQQQLANHIKSLRAHIDGLSRKNYPKYAQALDYVLLFIPIEPAFLEAVKTDSQLWKYAHDKRILLVSPTNLLAVLKIVADLWRIELQNKHAIEIAEKAGALYDKFHGFIDNFELVGKRISEAGNAYDNAFKQIATGRGNIITKVEELKKMGASAAKQLPERLLNNEPE